MEQEPPDCWDMKTSHGPVSRRAGVSKRWRGAATLVPRVPGTPKKPPAPFKHASAASLIWSLLVCSPLVWSGLLLSYLFWSGLVWCGLFWCGLLSYLFWSDLWSGLRGLLVQLLSVLKGDYVNRQLGLMAQVQTLRCDVCGVMSCGDSWTPSCFLSGGSHLGTCGFQFAPFFDQGPRVEEAGAGGSDGRCSWVSQLHAGGPGHGGPPVGALPKMMPVFQDSVLDSELSSPQSQAGLKRPSLVSPTALGNHHQALLTASVEPDHSPGPWPRLCWFQVLSSQQLMELLSTLKSFPLLLLPDRSSVPVPAVVPVSIHVSVVTFERKAEV